MNVDAVILRDDEFTELPKVKKATPHGNGISSAGPPPRAANRALGWARLACNMAVHRPCLFLCHSHRRLPNGKAIPGRMTRVADHLNRIGPWARAWASVLARTHNQIVNASA